MKKIKLTAEMLSLPVTDLAHTLKEINNERWVQEVIKENKRRLAMKELHKRMKNKTNDDQPTLF